MAMNELPRGWNKRVNLDMRLYAVDLPTGRRAKR